MINQKPVKISLLIVINIITIIIAVISTYFIANAQQDAHISKNEMNINIAKVRINENTSNIYDLKKSVSSFAPALNKRTTDLANSQTDVAVIKASLETMKQNIKDLKSNQIEFRRQQNIFYQRLAAKLGITFTR